MQNDSLMDIGFFCDRGLSDLYGGRGGDWKDRIGNLS